MLRSRRAHRPPTAAADETVLAFLLDVRSARHLDRAVEHLAPCVRAHQGPPGRAQHWLDRTPTEYADHVRDMHEDSGPWDFEVVSLSQPDDMPETVEAAWLQRSSSRGVAPVDGQETVEHGRARYLVRDGQIVEYWITAHTHTGTCAPTPEACTR